MRTGTVRPCTTKTCVKCGEQSAIHFPNYYNGAPMCVKHFHEYVDALGDAIVGRVPWRRAVKIMNRKGKRR